MVLTHENTKHETRGAHKAQKHVEHKAHEARDT